MARRKKRRQGAAGRKKPAPKVKSNPKSKSNPNKWADHYTRQARKDRYPARSIYKLKEIQAKYRLIRSGSRVLDLGCAPGAWLLYAAQKAGPGGRVVGVDIKPVTIYLPDQVRVITADLYDLDDGFWSDVGALFNTIISDLAPATTGNKMVDTARSFALNEAALDIARNHLAVGGSFVCKVFQGSDFQPFVETAKPLFKRLDIFKPKSSRKASREIYITGLTFLGGNHHVGT